MGFLIRKWPLLAAVASLLVALWQIDGVRIRAALRAGPEGGAPWATAALGPASHVATIEARPIAGLDANVSGLTYSRATGTLFVVINRPPAVAELSLEGKLLRHHPRRGRFVHRLGRSRQPPALGPAGVG